MMGYCRQYLLTRKAWLHRFFIQTWFCRHVLMQTLYILGYRDSLYKLGYIDSSYRLGCIDSLYRDLVL